MLKTTYRAINASICSVHVDDVSNFASVQPAQPEDKESLIQKIVRYYRGLAPFLIYVSGWMVWPAKWRLVMTGFLQALDALAAITPPESAPVVESAAADTTTTDPTSSDPSFKAGKDL